MRTAILFLMLALSTSARAGDHDLWSSVLERGVVDRRWVDYEGLLAEPEARRSLDTYLDELAHAKPSAMDEAHAIAYWINLYNALTVDRILDHYPVDSIKDIDDAWTKPLVTVEGRALSLDDIEHRILRVEFEEPRIHFALNCASVSCPPLADFAFEADHLDEQLDAVVERALADPTWLDVSGCSGAYSEGRIRLTKIFDWFEDDFGGEEGVRNFIARHRPDLRFVIENTGCRIEIMDYDWSLNAPPAESER